MPSTPAAARNSTPLARPLRFRPERVRSASRRRWWRRQHSPRSLRIQAAVPPRSRCIARKLLPRMRKPLPSRERDCRPPRSRVQRARPTQRRRRTRSHALRCRAEEEPASRVADQARGDVKKLIHGIVAAFEGVCRFPKCAGHASRAHSASIASNQRGRSSEHDLFPRY